MARKNAVAVYLGGAASTDDSSNDGSEDVVAGGNVLANSKNLAKHNVSDTLQGTMSRGMSETVFVEHLLSTHQTAQAYWLGSSLRKEHLAARGLGLPVGLLSADRVGHGRVVAHLHGDLR